MRLAVCVFLGLQPLLARADVLGQDGNCAFGDVDQRTLYITARQGLYRARLP